MNDEHGISYLMAPGTKLTRAYSPYETPPDITKAQGGAVHLAAGKSVGQMSAELREKGRQAFLEPSEVKQRMYHGTGQDIRQFKPKQAGASFVTPDPKFAHDFADLSENWMKRNINKILTSEQIQRAKDLTAKELTEHMAGIVGWIDDPLIKQQRTKDYEREIGLIGSPNAKPYTQTLYVNKLAEQLPSAQNIMPVHVQAKKPFDYENPKHVHAVRTMLHKLGHTQHIDDFDTAMRGWKRDDANWQTIESKPVQQAIRALGHDSFWVKEGGVKNLGVYNPGAIKSAIGNRGTYDTEDYDINKAQGGAVAPVKLKEGKQPPYQDPKTSKIDEWIWHPMERIRQELSARRELPEHVGPYADYMREMNAKAQSGELTPRDFVKAYTITQSSIGRGGLSHATATKRGMKLPNTGGEVRPEGAFAEWLGSPMGQKYLEASMRGEDHPEALADLREKFAPFGKQNAQVEAMQYATQNAPSLSERLNKAITGSKADYRKFAGGIKGIASAKSGFIGSLLGRGDLPTLDARQLNLHSLSHPTKTPEGMMSRGKGLGGQEAVDRLIARQEALGYNIPNELKPYEQHLIHHDVWDQRGGTQTTHKDLTKAMLGYGDGGSVEKMRRKLARGQPAGYLENTPLKPNAAVGNRYGITEATGLAPKTPVDLEQHKGASVMMLPWDSTSRNVEVRSISGRKLPKPVVTHGGQDYARDLEHIAQGIAGASNEAIAKRIATRESIARMENERAGGTGSVLHLPVTMGPHAEDFSMTPTEILHHFVRMAKLPQSEIDRMNQQISQHKIPKNGKLIQPFTKFVGLTDPKFYQQIHTGEGLDTTAGELRKAITDRLGYLKENQKALGFNIEDIVSAITDPALRGVPKGYIGNTVIGSDPDHMTLTPSKNKAYDTNFSGQYLGTLGSSFPAEVLFKQHMANLSKEFAGKKGDIRNMALGALEKRNEGVSQMLNNQTLDEYGKYLMERDRMLKRGKYAKGGKVAPVSMDEMLAHTTLAKKGPNVRNIGADEAPNMKVKQYIPPGPRDGIGLPSGGVDFQPEMPGQQLSQAVPAGPGGPTMPGMPGMPPGGPGMPPGGPGPGMPGMPPPLPRNQPGMPTGKPAGLEPPNIPPPKQKPTGSNILSMTPQGQALAALGPIRKMAKGGAVDDTDYRGEHAAPGPESGKPMHDTTGVYPTDFYGPRGFEYYANTHQPYDRASYNTVAEAKGNPDKMVWVHRAVPKDVYKAAMKTSEPTAHMIRPGDWVTPSREYAKEHGEGLGEGYHIARKRVPAKHLYTNADSIHEWGYHPEPMRKMADGGGVKRKIPEMETAVKALRAGVIDHAEYDRIVANHKPVKPYDFVPQPASDKDAARALMENKKAHWRGAEQWPAGRKIGMRLDIPAYEHHGVWVNSIHDEEGTGDNKFNTSYAPVSSVKNAVFDAKPSKAERVATGEQSKSPFARIKGELHHMSENEAVKLMQEHLHHPDWAQVGMDPRRHGFFYDRKTMQPVTHSEHVVQIGPLVLAKKPKYGKRETYAHGGGVTLPPSTEQMRQALSARRSNSKA